uniref:Retrovirus-related Pol polyprotein from transposon TNT 1-94-like beta-barrel domain-containing protein n=2 Tax=Cajanus cajan TaxID=3821 RepID=A0A151R6U4_CAJCA|nr:hypothetical protein KK1_040399 [Cajanus cajan]
MTNDLDNLHLTNSYHEQDQVIVGDGTAPPITHTRTTILHTTSNPLQLKTVLHVPTIAQNLLSVSSLCKTNDVSIEFFLTMFW